MPSVKNPADELRKVKELREKAIHKQAKIDALPKRELELKRMKRQQIAEIREQRLKREQEESEQVRRTIRDAEKERLQAEQERNEERKRKLADDMANVVVVVDDPATRHLPSKRKAAPDDAANPSAEPSFFDSMRSDEIQKYDADVDPSLAARAMDLDSVMNAATHRVLFSCPSRCGALASDKFAFDEWHSPSAWQPFVNRVNDVLLRQKEWPDFHPLSGEYNYVIDGLDVPSFVDLAGLPRVQNPATGERASWKGLVLRITRPQAETEPDVGAEAASSPTPPPRRYKSLRECSAEMQSVLEGAACGFGIPCYACFLFPAGVKRVNRQGIEHVVQLYGSVYVLKKASKNLNVLVFDRVLHATQTYRACDEMHACVKKGVAAMVASKILPLLVAQSKLHILNLDLKPGNILCCSNADVFLTDFDSNMYGSMGEACSWKGCLLVNCLFLLCHCRCWHYCAFAEAFCGAFRPILLQLAMHARADRWLYELRLKRVRFRPGEMQTVEQAETKICAMVSSYFLPDAGETNVDGQPAFKISPEFKTGRLLLPQMIKFALTGSSISRDPELMRVLGETE